MQHVGEREIAGEARSPSAWRGCPHRQTGADDGELVGLKGHVSPAWRRTRAEKPDSRSSGNIALIQPSMVSDDGWVQLSSRLRRASHPGVQNRTAERRPHGCF